MTKRFSLDKVTRRQKWITGAVAGALVVTIAAIAFGYWWSRAHKGRSMSAPQTLPSNVNQQLLGYTFTRSEEGRQLFTVHAARTVALKEGGATVLEDVFVEVFGRTGKRRDLLRTRRCDYNTHSGDLYSSGRVEIELNAQSPVLAATGLHGRPPVFLETSRVSFKRRGSLAASDESVKFRVGPVSGSAQGMAYGTREGWLELKKDVAIELRPHGAVQAEPSIQLVASRLRYERSTGEVELWGPLEIKQGSRRVVAEHGTVYLDENDRVTQATLVGNVQAFESSEASQLTASAQRVTGDFDPATRQLRRLLAEGGVRGESGRLDSVSRFIAEQLELSFWGANPQAQSGSASGNVQLTIESLADSAGRDSATSRSSLREQTLRADRVVFNFRPGELRLRDARTAGPGKLVLTPFDRQLGERLITASEFAMEFDAQGRLEKLRGSSPTRILFMPGSNAPPGSSPQESSAEQLEAAFDPATQTLLAVEQVGDFRFQDGERQASSEQARYLAREQRLELMGRPQLWDDQTRIKAEHIVFDLRADTAEGLGEVQSTHFDRDSKGGAGSRSEPTHVLADRVLAQRQSQFVRYEGHVRAWRGHDVVESSSLEIYRADRQVRSGSRVLSSHLQPASLAPGGAVSGSSRRDTSPVTIRADSLEYFDAGRKARYRGNVQLQTENTTLKADQLDVYFSEIGTAGGPRLERAVAEGQVTVVQPSRRASGERAEYDSAAGRIEVTGGRPELYDAERGLTTGQRLTFFIHDDRLFVDGGDKSPTLSKHRVAR